MIPEMKRGEHPHFNEPKKTEKSWLERHERIHRIVLFLLSPFKSLSTKTMKGEVEDITPRVVTPLRKAGGSLDEMRSVYGKSFDLVGMRQAIQAHLDSNDLEALKRDLLTLIQVRELPQNSGKKLEIEEMIKETAAHITTLSQKSISEWTPEAIEKSNDLTAIQRLVRILTGKAGRSGLPNEEQVLFVAAKNKVTLTQAEKGELEDAEKAATEWSKALRSDRLEELKNSLVEKLKRPEFQEPRIRDPMHEILKAIDKRLAGIKIYLPIEDKAKELYVKKDLSALRELAKDLDRESSKIKEFQPAMVPIYDELKGQISRWIVQLEKTN